MHVQELIKQRIKDERHRGTGAPSNMIPVSTEEDVQGARASSNSGVFLGGGGRSGGGRLTGLAIPQFGGEEGGEMRARGGKGNEDVVDESVPSSPVVDGSGGAGEEGNDTHGSEIAAAEGARDGEGQDGSAGTQAVGAKEGGGGGGAEDPDRRERLHSTPLLEDAELEARDAGVWFGHHEISRRVSSNVSSSVSGLVGAARAGLVLSEQELRAMGRWGEEVACKVLAERNDLCEVVWVNAHAETGHPYDITLRSKQDPQQVRARRIMRVHFQFLVRFDADSCVCMRACMCAHVCVFVRARIRLVCVRACVRACMRACMRAWQLVFVEVKSTLKMEQAQGTSSCPISLSELNFAMVSTLGLSILDP